MHVQKVFAAVVDLIPPPPVTEEEVNDTHLKAFLFDARFEPHYGVACLVKIMSGTFTSEKVRQLLSYHNNKRYEIYEIGVVQPNLVKTKILKPGQVGYFLSNMKIIADAHIGDTFFQEGQLIEPFPGYDDPLQVVFAGIYPEDADDYEELEKGLKKLCLTDASVQLKYESSAALGSGFRCGFLGMLHMDVFR